MTHGHTDAKTLVDAATVLREWIAKESKEPTLATARFATCSCVPTV